MSGIDLNKECFKIANDAAWDMRFVYEEARKSSLYTLGINKLSSIAILAHALYYAKKKEYVDTLVYRMARKNGKEVAYQVFKMVFPKFNTLNDLYDACYRLCQKNDDLKEVSKKVNMEIGLIRYYARESQLGLIKQDIERIEKKKKTVEEGNPLYYNAIMFLMEHDNLDEIVNYFENIDPSFKGGYLLVFAVRLFPEKTLDELRSIIKTRYDKYIHYKREIIQANDAKRKLANDMITEYITGLYPCIKSFCVIKEVEKRDFFKYLEIVKKHNPHLYEKYSEKALKIKNKEYNNKIDELQIIIDYICHGIDGREFTILDYFKLTKYDVKTFYYLIESSLTEEEYHDVVSFFRKYKNMELLTESYIMNEKREILCELNEKGLPIIGTGHVVTKEEKKKIIDLIKQDGYELYGPIYSIYLKRFFEDKPLQKVKKI